MKMSSNGDRTGSSLGASVLQPTRQPLGVEELVHHLRTGRTVTGEPVKPYKWLDFAGGERSTMELRVSRVMESCSFKSALSCVLGSSSRTLNHNNMLVWLLIFHYKILEKKKHSIMFVSDASVLYLEVILLSLSFVWRL